MVDGSCGSVPCEADGLESSIGRVPSDLILASPAKIEGIRAIHIAQIAGIALSSIVDERIRARILN